MTATATTKPLEGTTALVTAPEAASEQPPPDISPGSVPPSPSSHAAVTGSERSRQRMAIAMVPILGGIARPVSPNAVRSVPDQRSTSFTLLR